MTRRLHRNMEETLLIKERMPGRKGSSRVAHLHFLAFLTLFVSSINLRSYLPSNLHMIPSTSVRFSLEKDETQSTHPLRGQSYIDAWESGLILIGLQMMMMVSCDFSTFSFLWSIPESVGQFQMRCACVCL